MTDLEKSLIAIGGVFVAGVFVYNKWQEYKTRKSVERAFSSTHEDVLMNSAGVPAPASGPTREGRHEPSFVDEAPDDTHTQIESVDDHRIEEAGEHTPEIAIVPPKSLPVDDMIDCIIPLTLTTRMRGDKVLPALQALRHAGNKPVHFIGLREDQVWETITHAGVYTTLHAGVQLANRSSALNELEYSEFVNLLRQVSDELDAEPDLPDMNDVMKSARALQQFVTRFDAQLSVNIQSNGAPWAISTLLAALERQGFDVRPDGKLVMPDGDGGILFLLSTNVTLAADTTSRLTLLLDVPCVTPQRDGYGAMISFAKVLAARLGGSVVDDTNQPLSDAALGEIAGQVQAFCGDMENLGVAAGSPRALRLFN
jgi:hypothetical protein